MSVTYEDLTYTQLLADPTVSPSIGFIDLAYYKETYFGEDPDNDNLLTKLIIRSTDDIGAYTNWQIDDITEYSTIVKNLIYRATAAQTEYYVLNGENYNDDDSDNVKIGKYSYGGSGSKSTGAVQICPRALMFLEQSGLTNRAVGVCYE